MIHEHEPTTTTWTDRTAPKGAVHERGDEEDVERRRELVNAARPYLEALSRAASGERHVATMVDEDGVILLVAADGETFAAGGMPRPGSRLSGAAAGPTGVAGALADLLEVADAQAARAQPLAGLDRKTVGVLGIALEDGLVAARVREILMCAAHGVAAELALQRLEHELSGVRETRIAGGARVEALRDHVAQLTRASAVGQVRTKWVGEQSRGGLQGLLSAAEALVRRYRRTVELWRTIAVDDTGALEPLDLQHHVEEAADLLAIDAAARDQRIRVRPHPPVRVTTDPRELSRDLFRCLLAATEVAPPGAEVEVWIETRPGRGEAHVRFSSLGTIGPEFVLTPA